MDDVKYGKEQQKEVLNLQEKSMLQTSLRSSSGENGCAGAVLRCEAVERTFEQLKFWRAEAREQGMARGNKSAAIGMEVL